MALKAVPNHESDSRDSTRSGLWLPLPSGRASLLGLLQHLTMNWKTSDSRNLLAHSSGGQKAKVKVSAGPCSL